MKEARKYKSLTKDKGIGLAVEFDMLGNFEYRVKFGHIMGGAKEREEI